jgi:hypothetical protein
MSLTFEAVYDGTTFRPEGPVDLKPNTRVQVIVHRALSKKSRGTPRSKPVVLKSGHVDLRAHGINRKQAADLRARMACCSDWDDPSMDVYDHYDEFMAKHKSKAR